MSAPSYTCSSRAELEARIEEMISLLDMLDGDCDLEENGDADWSGSNFLARPRSNGAWR